MQLNDPVIRSKPAALIASMACFIAVSFSPVVAVSSGESSEASQEIIDINTQHSREPIQPIPDNKTFNSGKVALGEKLFKDRRLDSNQRRACADCHNLEIGGTDKLAFSLNSAGKATRFNTPTIFNVSLNSQYYWSGKFLTLEDQISDALKELNTTWPQLVYTVNAIPEYADRFNALYADGVTEQNIRDAFIHFERSLLTPNSAFDRFLKGEPAALGRNQLQGYKLFKSYGCITCHQGKNIGGNFVLNMNKMGAPFGNLNSTRERLQGKLQQIRVPSLRNVALTAPYFHDGSATTLYQAVQRMIDEYLGMNIAEEDIYYIVSFLNSLTGEYKGKKL